MPKPGFFSVRPALYDAAKAEDRWNPGARRLTTAVRGWFQSYLVDWKEEASDNWDNLHQEILGSFNIRGDGPNKCFALKPEARSLKEVAASENFDLGSSWLLSHEPRDIEVAKEAGVGMTILLISDGSVAPGTSDANYTVSSFKQAEEIVDEFWRHQPEPGPDLRYDKAYKPPFETVETFLEGDYLIHCDLKKTAAKVSKLGTLKVDSKGMSLQNMFRAEKPLSIPLISGVYQVVDYRDLEYDHPTYNLHFTLVYHLEKRPIAWEYIGPERGHIVENRPGFIANRIGSFKQFSESEEFYEAFMNCVNDDFQSVDKGGYAINCDYGDGGDLVVFPGPYGASASYVGRDGEGQAVAFQSRWG